MFFIDFPAKLKRVPEDAPNGAISNRPFRVGILVEITNIDNSKSPIGGDILIKLSSKENFVYNCRYS